MKKSLVAGVALMAVITGPAMAADLPVKAPRMVVEESFSWSRCYIGAHAGYGWGRNRNSFGDAIETGNSEGEGLPGEAGPFHHNTSGGVIGGQLGCNYQFANNWLIGIEGEIWWSGIKGSFTAPEDEPGAQVTSRASSPGTVGTAMSHCVSDTLGTGICCTARPAWRLVTSTTPKRTTTFQPLTPLHAEADGLPAA
jgi:outer membrane immunogenic protein